MKTLPALIILLYSVLNTAPARVTAPGERLLRIRFSATVNGEALRFSSPYKNSFGEDFTVTAFRYYLAHLEINSASGKKWRPAQKYRLVDASIDSSQFVDLALSDDNIDNINFQIGVDSIDNVSGAQDGELDPARGMFWTWNSGYVMAKLEGASSYSSVPDGNFSYHIGGYKGHDSALREITLHLSVEQKTQLTKSGNVEIIIEPDLNKWFNGTHPISIATKSFVHSSGNWAQSYADNYAEMFRTAAIKLKP